MKNRSIVFVILLGAFFSSCGLGNDQSDTKNSSYQQMLIDEGWDFDKLDGDDLPKSYGVVPQKGIVDNYLDIELGEGTDMAIKIVDVNTDETIRYVFVEENSTSTITEIPAGRYYFKIAFGKDWMSRTVGNTTEGKFTREVEYEKSEEYFDFGMKGPLDKDSYSLKIRKEHDKRYESFATSEISEEEFFMD